jgi:beta-1,4-mannosyl-glycoprotein beta-1,4-N-acetylglucosaminyltransferase
MKIYDCFLYFDEDFLLEIRLNILNNYVDQFIIVEGERTWQNNYKGFNFDINKYKKFKNKITYLKVKNLPEGENPWLRENYQRNYISEGLHKANENDLIIISDLDEIPKPEAIKAFQPKDRYAVFKQKHFYYKINLQSTSNPYWLGSRICVKKYLISPQWLRNLKFKKRPFWRIDKYRLNNILDDSGWHFCNLKKPEDLVFKYKNLCETNDKFAFNTEINAKFLNTESIRKAIQEKKDLVGRKDTFQIIQVNNNYPEYIRKNLNKFKNWIAT